MAKAASASYNARVMAVALPPWVPFVIGLLVFTFGAYRIRLAFRKPEVDEEARKRGGLYGMGKRTHFLVGVVYIIGGVMLILWAFGIDLRHVLPGGAKK
jgi:hypothetical protein